MTLLDTVYMSLWLTPADLVFLFLFLPLFLFVYYVVPVRARPAVLLLQSLYFYTVVDGGAHLLLLLGALVPDFLVLRLLERYRRRDPVRRALVGAVAVKNLALIAVAGVRTGMGAAPPVFGLQVCLLVSLGAVVAAHREESPAVRSPVLFGLGCLFYPRLYTGPLQPCGEFARGVDGVRLRVGAVLAGMGRLVLGAFKTGVLGAGLYELCGMLDRLYSVTALAAWCRVLGTALAVYYLLTGLCDMAGGLSAMYGFGQPQQFYFPYQSRNIGDFLHRFLITVERFWQWLLPPPAPGGAAEVLRTLAVCGLWGLWFGMGLNYFLWGLFFGALLLLERRVYPGVVRAVPTLFGRVGTLCLVLASFTIFLGDTPAQSGRLILSMLDFGNFLDEEILYVLLSNWLLLAASLVLATSAFSLLFTKLRRVAPRVMAGVAGAAGILLLVLLVALSL